jgi:hypothetical protein
MKFTMELETYGLLPYLDIVVTTKLGGSLSKLKVENLHMWFYLYEKKKKKERKKKRPCRHKNVVLIIPLTRARVPDM